MAIDRLFPNLVRILPNFDMDAIRRYVQFFSNTPPQISVSQLWIYPLKSARGIRVDSAVLSALGFEHDRVFMLVEEKPSKDDSSKPKWTVMTLRTWPKMGLLRTGIEIKNGENILRVYVRDDPRSIEIPLVPSNQLLETLDYIPSEVDIWGALVQPYDMGKEYSIYFSDFLGTNCKLAYVNINRPRYIQGPLPPLCCQNGKHPRTGLSDGAPYLICAEESMEDLNSRMEKAISIIRFRPNIVLRGGKPFDEDNWAEITIGEAGKFWLLTRSPRCQIPNVDVETGTKDKDYPYKTLTKYRRVDKGSPYSPCFGMNAAADRIDGAVVRVGDVVRVLRIEEPRPHSNKLDISRIA